MTTETLATATVTQRGRSRCATSCNTYLAAPLMVLVPSILRPILEQKAKKGDSSVTSVEKMAMEAKKEG